MKPIANNFIFEITVFRELALNIMCKFDHLSWDTL